MSDRSRWRGPALGVIAWVASSCSAQAADSKAPDAFHVRLDTSQGAIVIELRREWAPLGVDRFFTLVEAGYFDEARFFRVRAGRFAQFGVNGDPKVSQAWRSRRLPDEPRVLENKRGTLAFAFAVEDGRTTQLFFNLVDNPDGDKEPFVPIGRIVQGIDVPDKLYAGYGEAAGGGIRGGRQARLLEEGNAYLSREFPELDWIRRASIEP